MMKKNISKGSGEGKGWFLCLPIILVILFVSSCDSIIPGEEENTATPTFSPQGGTYATDQSVTISCATAGATIYYTTDGSAPSASSEKYASPIAVSGDGTTKTIKAMAQAPDHEASDIASAMYTIKFATATATPTFSPPGGYYDADQNVTLSCATEGATIYYTTDGSEPTSASTKYTDPITVIVDPSTTLKALALANGFLQSDVGTAIYSETPLIGIALPETYVYRWINDGNSLKNYVEAKGYHAELASADANQATQNEQIQTMLTNGADLIIVACINTGVATVVAEAAAAGVPIISYDRLIKDTDKYDHYISFDNFKVGQLQGEALKTALDLPNVAIGAQKTITLFAGSHTDNNAHVFFDGAMSILRPYLIIGVLNIVGPDPWYSTEGNFIDICTENWDAANARTRMDDLLDEGGAAHGIVLDGILAPNDPVARALIDACLESTYTVETLPVVTGQDGEIESIKYIRDDKQYMTVFKDTRKLAEAAVDLAEAILLGETPNITNARLDTESYNTGLKLVDAYLLAPELVNKGNYVEVMIDSGYISAEDLE